MADLPIGYTHECKPETHNGVEYKSQLELRWARWFADYDWSDVLSPPIYELHKYKLGRFGTYTPDFTLSCAHWNGKDEDTRKETVVILEVKPRAPLFHEIVKSYALSQLVGPRVFFIVGEPPAQTAARNIFILDQIQADRPGIIRDAAGLPPSMWRDTVRAYWHVPQQIRGMNPAEIM